MFSESERKFLLAQSFCRLATISEDGWPHNVPVGYAFNGEFFYITSDPGAKKVRNLRHSPRVCLVIDVLEKPKRGVMVQGRRG